MNFAFDLDGTFSARPDVLSVIGNALINSGHRVVILTGALGPTNGGDPEWRRAQIESLGLKKGEHFSECIIARGGSFEEVADMKGVFCRDEKMMLMIEDTDLFIEGVKRHSPNTLCLRMR